MRYVNNIFFLWPAIATLPQHESKASFQPKRRDHRFSLHPSSYIRAVRETVQCYWGAEGSAKEGAIASKCPPLKSGVWR
jgi:hypothetical protein